MIGCLLKYSVYLKTYLVRELMRMLDDFLDAPTRRSAISNQRKILILIFFASGSYQKFGCMYVFFFVLLVNQQ
jgi:hypothetical protein